MTNPYAHRLLFLSLFLLLAGAVQACCLPNIGFGTDSTCQSNYYDAGGPTGDYFNNQNRVHTICGVNGSDVRIFFTLFETYSGDTLFIYDGNSTGATQIAALSGIIAPGTFTASNGCLTFEWKTNASAARAGWEALIDCVCAKPVNAGEDKSVCPGEIATLYGLCDTTQVPEYFEDFESGAPGWTTGLLSGSVNAWAISNQSGGSAPQAFGSNRYGTPNTGPELGWEHSYLQSPQFNTTGGAQIKFKTWVNNDNLPRDVESVWISYDGGTNWSYFRDSLSFFWIFKNFTLTHSIFVPPDSGTATTVVRFTYNTWGSGGGTDTRRGSYIDDFDVKRIINGNCTYDWQPINGASAQMNVSPTQTTVYQMFATDPGGCTTRDEVKVSVLTQPTVDAIQNPAICLGDSVTLTATPHCNKDLETTFEAGNGAQGNMFDITAVEDVIITGFDAHVTSGFSDFEVYYKTGTYVGFETTPGAWTLLGTATNVPAAGFETPTPVPIIFSVPILQGNTAAFYVTTTSGSTVNYTNGTGAGNLYRSDANIQFFEGVGKQYPFAGTFSPRIFNGIIHYERPQDCNIEWTLNNTPDSITVQPNQSNSYTVEINDNLTGCTNFDNVQVILDPAPLPDPGPNVNICPGDTTVLAVSDTCENTLWTTFAGGLVDNGAMFDITTLDNIVIRSIDVNMKPGVYNVRIYYKTGTHVGFETSTGSWTLLGTAPNLASDGTGNPTRVPIPIDIALAGGQTRAFYVTITGSGDMLSTTGTGVNNVYSADANLQIREGKTITYPFSFPSGPAVFNGIINYESQCDVFNWMPGGNTTSSFSVAPTNTTAYSIAVTNANGCTDSATVKVVVDTLTVNAGSDKSMCPGDSVTLTANCISTVPNYVEDFESGAPGWSSGITGGFVNGWSFSQTSGGFTPVTFPSTMYGTPNAGPELGFERSYIQSPSLNTLGGGEISFDSWANNENGNYDREHVLVSYDGGTNWSALIDYTDPVWANLNIIQNITATIPADSGTSNTIIRFFYNTIDGSVSPGSPVGWYIDNFELKTSCLFTWMPGGQTSASITVSPASTTDYICNSTTGTGCFGSDTVTVNVFGVTTPVIGNLATDYCIDATGSTLTGTPSGGAFSGPGMGGNIFFPQIADTGSHTIRYIVTDGNGCTDSTSQGVAVHPLPEPDFAGLSPSYCVSDPPDTLMGLPPGGTFSGSGITGNAFLPSVAGLGSHTITYTYTDGFGCLNDTSKSTTVNASPVIAIVGLNNAYCVNDTPVTLQGSPPGGTFAGPGVTGNTFDPAAAGIGTHTITYTYTDTNTCTNSTSQNVTVQALPGVTFFGLPSDECINNPSDTLTGFPANGTFAGTGMTNNVFDPGSAGLGTHSIQYTFTDQNGCTNDTTQDVTVHPLPQAGFEVQFNSSCAGDTLWFIDTTTAIPGDSITYWDWTFGDGSVGSGDTVSHVYGSGGDYVVWMGIETELGCNTSWKDTIPVGDGNVVANFSIRSLCNGDTTFFADQSQISPGEIVQSYAWTFGDGTPTLDSNLSYVNHTYANPGLYPVELTITTDKFCRGTAYDTLRIWPLIPASGFPYYEDWETGRGSWAEGGANSAVVSWDWGQPGGLNIDTAGSGLNCWATNLASEYFVDEHSYVGSPCFDFSNLFRPMIAFKMIDFSQEGFDGVVLQASVDGDSTWQPVGDFGDPVNWYNKLNLIGDPGGQNLGWSNSHHEWVTARHKLDSLKGNPRVRFRFALGTDESTNEEGFAFDSLWIGERNKTALVEQFTNSSGALDPQANTYVYNLAEQNLIDVAPIFYHIKSALGLAPDPMNDDNPTDASGRELFYGISAPPWNVFDGDFYQGNPLGWVQDSIDKRVLERAKFKISLQPLSVGGSTVSAFANVTYVDPEPHTGEVVVQLVVIERDITGLTGANGETQFDWVMKKMIPDAAGTQFTQTWTSGMSQFVSGSWQSQNVYNASNLGIVAFVQDRITKEVFQAAYNGPGMITDIEDDEGVAGGGIPQEILVYPNPARSEVFVLAPGQRLDRVEVWNLVGQQVKVATPRAEKARIETENLPAGVYLLRIESNGKVETRKIEVVR